MLNFQQWLVNGLNLSVTTIYFNNDLDRHLQDIELFSCRIIIFQSQLNRNFVDHFWKPLGSWDIYKLWFSESFLNEYLFVIIIVRIEFILANLSDKIDGVVDLIVFDSLHYLEVNWYFNGVHTFE